MTIPSSSLLALWILAGLAGSSLAQTNKLFQWQFANAALSSLLPTCTPLQIVVKSFDPTTNATNGTPPYYMISFAVGGTPVTTFIGTDENNLSWTITQPVDSQLMLSVVDANGSAGGIPPQLSTVIAGQSTRCVTPPSTPSFTVTANVTDELTTCQPWGLTVKGGVPPYNVTLAAVNSPIVTNVTMPFGLDVFTFIDRADPGTQLLAAISDFTGQWATGTPIVKTRGQTDVSCVGLVSSSGNSTQIKQQQDAANVAAQSAKRKHSAVVGVAVTLVLLVVFGLAGAAFFQLRKRKREAEEELAQTRPTQFVEPEPQMEPNNNYPERPPVSEKAALAMREAQNSYSNAVSVLHRPSPSQSSSGLLSSQDNLGRSTSATASGSTDVRPQRPGSQLSIPGFANFPTTSIRRSAKATEASGTTTRPSDSEHPESPFNDRRSPLATRVNEGLVFQHQDADRVQELPPPYADRARRSRPSSS